MAEKAHLIVWYPAPEEWLVEGASNAAEAKEIFLDGNCELVRRSDFFNGRIGKVRQATDGDRADAAMTATATVAQSSPACDVAQRALAIADDMVRMMMDRGALLAVRDNDGELVPMDIGRQFQLKAGWQTAIAGALKSSGVEQP